MATMGVLYDVMFKPIGRGDGGPTASAAALDAATATAAGCDPQTPPEWVLDERDGGSLVWRRYGGPAASLGGRRRVEFLDAVEVRVFERDDYGAGGDDDDDDDVDAADAVDGQQQQQQQQQQCWADDWCWDEWDDGTKKLQQFYPQPGGGPDDYPVLAAVSVTVLGLCFGLAYLFAPVRWLLHQLTVDD